MSSCLELEANSASSASSVGRCSGATPQDVPVREDRAVEVCEVDLKDLSQPVTELDDLLRRRPDLRFAREDLREVGPALRLEEQPVERADREEVLRVDGDDRGGSG